MDEREKMNTLHKIFPTFFLILVLGIVFFISPSVPAKEKRLVPEPEEISGKVLPHEAKRAAEHLLQNISIPSTSIVHIVGPVKSGTLIEEEHPFKGEQIARLVVPSGAGTYYVFYINDKPDFKFAHPVRYAWVNLDTGETRSVDAEWWPKISEPGMLPIHFKHSSSGVVNDVLFIFSERGEEGENP